MERIINGEICKSIVGYPDYLISPLGTVYSCRINNIKCLKGYYDKIGERVVEFTDKNIKKSFRVKRLVAEHFIPNPDNKPNVSYKSDNVADNSIFNLEWTSPNDEYLERNGFKKCTKCKHTKDITHFHIKVSSFDGYSYMCKECTVKYKRTEDNLICDIYSKQLSHSKTRDMLPPSYNLNELRKWVYSNSNFKELYSTWVASGYEKDKRPSVDRLDNNLGYTFDNIQLVTWYENNNKQYKANEKTVYVYFVASNIIKVFNSLKHVSKFLGVKSNTVSGGIKYGSVVSKYHRLYPSGASLLGVLSGGNSTPVTIGKNTLLGANSVCGISLGDGCILDAGCTILAGTKISVTADELDKIIEVNPDKENHRQFSNPKQFKCSKQFKGSELSGMNGLHIRQNSETGKITLTRSVREIELTQDLH